MMRSILLITAVVAMAGCATALTDAGQKVRIVTANQKERCETIKMVNFNQRLGPDKPVNAMKAVLNETAAVGGNGFYMVSSSADWAEGASVIGEALRCKE